MVRAPAGFRWMSGRDHHAWAPGEPWRYIELHTADGWPTPIGAIEAWQVPGNWVVRGAPGGGERMLIGARGDDDVKSALLSVALEYPALTAR